MRKKWIVLAPLAIVGFALFFALGGLVVRELWNWLLPQLFGFPRVGFWQALGILALSRILFGGFGMSSRASTRSRMTPEERERFRARMRERFGFGPAPSESERP